MDTSDQVSDIFVMYLMKVGKPFISLHLVLDSLQPTSYAQVSLDFALSDLSLCPLLVAVS